MSIVGVAKGKALRKWTVESVARAVMFSRVVAEALVGALGYMSWERGEGPKAEDSMAGKEARSWLLRMGEMMKRGAGEGGVGERIMLVVCCMVGEGKSGWKPCWR